MVFLEDRDGNLHWKIFRGISLQPLGAKTGGGSRRDAACPSETLFCPFWVHQKKGQEEKVFLVPNLYMRPPSSHTWALLCTLMTSYASCRKCVGCHSVKLEVSCQRHVRLVVCRKRQHSLRARKSFG